MVDTSSILKYEQQLFENGIENPVSKFFVVFEKLRKNILVGNDSDWLKI